MQREKIQRELQTLWILVTSKGKMVIALEWISGLKRVLEYKRGQVLEPVLSKCFWNQDTPERWQHVGTERTED